MISLSSSINSSLREQSTYLFADNSVIIHKVHSSLKVQALACLERIMNIFTFLANAIRETYHSLINRVKKKDSQGLTEEQIPNTPTKSPFDGSSRRDNSPKLNIGNQHSPTEPRVETIEFKEEKRNPKNEKAAYIHQDSTKSKEEYINEKNFLVNFINESPEDPFRVVVNEIAASEKISYKIENLDLRAIEVPNKAALELQALKYAEKYRNYEVNIKITHIDQLDIVVDELQRESRKARYVGIIVGDKEFEGHVLPLLCYFNPHSKNEFLILDINPEYNTLSRKVQAKLQTKVTTQENIIVYRGYCRQADHYSCRTGALSLLCNALLSLRYYQHNNGFGQVLIGYFYQSPRLLGIPEDWAVHEQIFQGEGEKKHIRDLVSNNPEKRANPRTIAAVRASHKQNVRMKYTLFGIDNRHTPPPGVEFDANSNQISFERTIRIDTYLVRKAARRKRELEAIATMPSV